jgi:SSS family solute:Na+ symporter
MPIAQLAPDAARLPQGALATLDYVIVIIYLVGMLALGAIISSRIKGFKDYFLAGGALTTPLLICTLVSSYYGIDVTFGTSESGFYYGVVAWFWYSLPYYFFIAFAALVIAPRLRRYGEAMTLSDVLEQHYGQGTRVVGAAACFVYSAPVLAMAGLMTLAEHLGMSPTWGLATTIGICAIYTTMGGLWADVLSDTVQFVLMCVSLAIAIPFAVHWVGGWEFVANLPPHEETGENVFMQHHGGLSPWMLAAWALTGLTVLIEPAFYQRVFAAQDKRSVPRALFMGIFLWAAYDWGVTLIGIIAKAAVQQGLLAENLEGKAALLTLSAEILPTGLRGLMVGGIIAAAMANVDSYSLLASANVVYDIYRPLLDPSASEKRLMVLTRGGVFIVMFAAAAISLLFERMRDAWQFMASVMAAVLFVPLMGALFARPRRAAGIWGALAGAMALIAFYSLLIVFGDNQNDEQVYVWRIGGVEIWQDYAVLCTLPISFIGYTLGNVVGRREP